MISPVRLPPQVLVGFEYPYRARFLNQSSPPQSEHDILELLGLSNAHANRLLDLICKQSLSTRSVALFSAINKGICSNISSF
jgi:hypothetical protein